MLQNLPVLSLGLRLLSLTGTALLPELPTEIPEPNTLPEPNIVSQAQQGDSISLPILMYHSVQDDTTKYHLNDFVLSTEEMEADLIYLKEIGYTAIFMEDVIDYVFYQGDLPEKPIVLSFDDGYMDNYVNLFPLLEEYETKAVISFIGSLSSKNSPVRDLWGMTNAQTKEMEQSGLVEFQCHTYDMHFSQGREGSLPLEGEDSLVYQNILQADLQKNRDKFAQIGLTPASTFSYPGGLICQENQSIIKELFQASFGIYPSTANIITRGDADCLYNLSRYNRSPNIPPEEFFTFLTA